VETLSQDIQQKLMRAMGFTEADLDANARGVVTEDQRRRLIHGVLRQFMLTITGIIFIGSFTFVIAFFRAGMIVPPGTTLVSQYAALAVLFFALLTALLLVFLRRSLRKPVESVEGLVELRKNRIGWPRHAVCIGELEFTVSEETFDMFEDSMPYRVYYLQPSIILSAESLASTQSSALSPQS
jgi:hypothetical protein